MALGANWMFLFQAYKHTTISNAVLSYYFAPVFVLILSPLVLKEKLSVKKIITIAVAMLGMVFIVGNSGVSTSGWDHLIGIGYGLMAAGFYAALMLLNKFIKNMDGLETTVIQLGTATMILIPYVFFTEGFGILANTKFFHSIYFHLRDCSHRYGILVILLRDAGIKRAEHRCLKLCRSRSHH